MVPQNSNSNHNSYGNVHQHHQQHAHVTSMGNQSMVVPTGGSVNTSPTNNGSAMVANTSYLSPPLDPSWRRTHSDSALHEATLAQDNSSSSLLHGNNCTSSAMNSRRGQVEMIFENACDPNQSSSLSVTMGTDGRPKSCCDVSRVPGIK